MVVDIYGSKEIFVNEYRNLLADRLLAQLDFETTRELANLEHLKLRFDESMLHTCDVMLKDISDSKRINAHIHSTLVDDKTIGNYVVDYHLYYQCRRTYRRVSSLLLFVSRYSIPVQAILVDFVITILATVQNYLHARTACRVEVRL